MRMDEQRSHPRSSVQASDTPRIKEALTTGITGQVVPISQSFCLAEVMKSMELCGGAAHSTPAGSIRSTRILMSLIDGYI